MEKPIEKKEAKLSEEEEKEADEEKEEIEKEKEEEKKEAKMTAEEKKEAAQSCEAGCASGMQARFQKLSIKFKKLSDAVEKDSILNKFDVDKFTDLQKGYKEAVTFIRKEERKLKKEESLSTLDAKDRSDFLIAENHHGIMGLSTHISKILDEVYDFQGVKKNLKKQAEPDPDVMAAVDEIEVEIKKLCKYDA